MAARATKCTGDPDEPEVGDVTVTVAKAGTANTIRSALRNLIESSSWPALRHKCTATICSYIGFNSGGKVGETLDLHQLTFNKEK